MSKFDDVIQACKKQMTNQKIKIDEALLTAVTKGLGPSIYNADTKVVAAGDKAEVDRVKKNFIEKKLGVSGDKGDKAFEAAIEKIGVSNRQKLRPVLYYLLVKELGKESVYN